MDEKNEITRLKKTAVDKFEHVPCALCKTDNTRKLFRVQNRDIVRCRECGLAYVNPRPSHERIIDLYGEQYFAGRPKGTDTSGEKPEHNYFNCHHELNQINRFSAELSEINKLSPKGRILDIGCATGKFLSLAKNYGWDTYGVDVSEYATRYAREKLGLKVFTGQLADANFPEAYFDVITMHHVLEHIPDPVGFLSGTVYPHLKINGILLIEVPNFSSVERIVNKTNWQDLRPLEHLYHFNSKTLGITLKKSGFNIIKIFSKGEYGGVKPALHAIGIPRAWTASLNTPDGWWSDIEPALENLQGNSKSKMPAIRKVLEKCLIVPGLLIEIAGFGKRLISIAQKNNSVK